MAMANNPAGQHHMSGQAGDGPVHPLGGTIELAAASQNWARVESFDVRMACVLQPLA